VGLFPIQELLGCPFNNFGFRVEYPKYAKSEQYQKTQRGKKDNYLEHYFSSTPKYPTHPDSMASQKRRMTIPETNFDR
jgi:hypothetical protein